MNLQLLPQISPAAAKVLLALASTQDPHLPASRLAPLTGLSIRSCFYALRQLRDLQLIPHFYPQPPAHAPVPLQPVAATAKNDASPPPPLQPLATTATPCTPLDQALAALFSGHEDPASQAAALAAVKNLIRESGALGH